MEDIQYPITTSVPTYGTAATEERNYVPAIENVAPGITEIANQIAVEGESWISAISRAMSTVAMADPTGPRPPGSAPAATERVRARDQRRPEPADTQPADIWRDRPGRSDAAAPQELT